MKRLPISILLLALLCLPQNNCRTTLHHAAAKGDIATPATEEPKVGKEGDMPTVQQELKAGTDVNLGIADMGPANILYIPGDVLLMAADISTIVLAVGTLGQYFYVVKAIGDPNRPFLFQKMRATPGLINSANRRYA
ncbi:MAG: hypothetical protein E7033_08365 [Akkermansiaceae bacterium]|nr:hypothetical protein [Akkermansiaceae bacterium]